MKDIFLNNPLGEMLGRATNIKQDDIFISVFSLGSVQDFVLDLNRSQLKNQYMNSEGVLLSDIGGDYSPYTIQISQEEGRPKAGIDKVDLHSSGAFYASFNVSKVNGTDFEITANPIKDDGTNLFNEWGTEVLGLTAGSLDELIRIIIPMYQDAILKYLMEQ